MNKSEQIKRPKPFGILLSEHRALMKELEINNGEISDDFANRYRAHHKELKQACLEIDFVRQQNNKWEAGVN